MNPEYPTQQKREPKDVLEDKLARLSGPQRRHFRRALGRTAEKAGRREKAGREQMYRGIRLDARQTFAVHQALKAEATQAG